MLTVGDKLPALSVPVQQGVAALPAGESLDLGKTNGKWKILFYWPKDFTFVCPTEIVGYGDLKQDFADRDAELIGASTDTDHVHFAWRQKRALPIARPSSLTRTTSSSTLRLTGSTSVVTQLKHCGCWMRCRPMSF